MRNGKEQNESTAHLVAEEGLIERLCRLLKKLVMQSALYLLLQRPQYIHRDHIAPTSIHTGSFLGKACFKRIDFLPIDDINRRDTIKPRLIKSNRRFGHFSYSGFLESSNDMRKADAFFRVRDVWDRH